MLRFPNGTPSPCLYCQPFVSTLHWAPRHWWLPGTCSSTIQHGSSLLNTCKSGCFVLWSPTSGPVLYTQSHKYWTEGNNHGPCPAGYTLANTTQHVIGLLCFWEQRADWCPICQQAGFSGHLQHNYCPPSLPPSCSYYMSQFHVRRMTSCSPSIPFLFPLCI